MRVPMYSDDLILVHYYTHLGIDKLPFLLIIILCFINQIRIATFRERQRRRPCPTSRLCVRTPSRCRTRRTGRRSVTRATSGPATDPSTRTIMATGCAHIRVGLYMTRPQNVWIFAPLPPCQHYEPFPPPNADII